MKFTAIVDTREQSPWYWTESDYCDGYVVQGLKVGDYSLIGYEDVLSIERKANTAEWARNICEDRFERELVKLSKYKYAFIICEFSMDDILNFPLNSGIPASKLKSIKVKPDYILKRTMEIQVQHGIRLFLAGNKVNGWKAATSIFKRVIENEQRNIEG